MDEITRLQKRRDRLSALILVASGIVIVAAMVAWRAVRTDTPRREASAITVEINAEPIEMPIDTEVRGPMEGEKLVALTFDDGPDITVTPKILDTLKEKGVKATFFTVGGRMKVGAEVVLRELAEGHEVGGHSTGHYDLLKLTPLQVEKDMEGIRRVYRDVTGGELRLMRPPYGADSGEIRRYAGMPIVNWSVDPLDWKNKDAEYIREYIREASFDGAVILLHDLYETTAEAVPGIIDTLREEGYYFVTVSELARARGVEMRDGEVYTAFRP